METARCTENGEIYEAVQFSNLLPNELARKRRLLRCPECDGPAFFRKASRGGRAACFGARPHADGCELATVDHELHEDGEGAGQDVLENPGEHIVVDFNYGAVTQPEHEGTPNLPQNPTRRGRFIGDGVRPDARTHRRLSSLLRTLVEVPAFRQSNQILEIENRGDVSVREFFVPLDAVTTEHAGVFRGFWGMLSDAKRTTDGTLWLNSGGRADISFCLSSGYVNGIYERYGIEEEEDIAGAYILVFGTANVSQNQKLYCPVTDPGYMCLRLIR